MADTLVARKRRQEDEAAAAAEAALEHHRLARGNSNSISNSSHNRHHQQQQQQQQQQDPRRPSAWSKMSLKGGFGTGSRNGSQSAPAPAGPAADVAGVGDPGEAGAGGRDRARAEGAVGSEAASSAARVEAGGAAAGDSVGAGEGGGGGGGSSTAGNSKRYSDGNTGCSGETWIHRIFQGVLTNQTKCLCCETVRLPCVPLYECGRSFLGVVFSFFARQTKRLFGLLMTIMETPPAVYRYVPGSS